jgi:molybdopterin molybdotransferase
MTALLPVAEAIRRVLTGVAPLPAETTALAEAAGRVLAAPLDARRSQPPFDSSAMDGYAVRAADLAEVPARLRLIGVSAAGRRFAGTVGPGEAVRIFTGAPVPAGADAILIQEDAEAGEAGEAGAVIARRTVAAGEAVRPAGLDFAAGARALEAGRVLGMRELALAAAMGHGAVAVRRRPRIALIATGDELVPPGADPGPDQIVASTGVGIAAYARSLGAAADDLGIVGDDTAAIGGAIDAAAALSADVLVTLGGASVGDHDLVQPALAARGMSLDFWRIAMRPGKPLMHGTIARPDGGQPMRVLGLPGNPVSGIVCAILFLRPLVEALLGLPPSDPSGPATVGAAIAANGGRQDYMRAVLAERDGGNSVLPVATPLAVQDSSMLSTLAAADCLLVRPPHAPAAAPGDPCRIIRLP